MSFRITENTTLKEIKKYLQYNQFTDEIIQFIVRKGSVRDINTIKSTTQKTALLYSSSNSNSRSSENTVKMLLEAGADVNIKDYMGKTPLMYACEYSNKSSTENTVKMLIDAGAAYAIPKRSMNMDEIALIALTAAATFTILDTFLPSMAVSARQGAGMGMGFNLVGFPRM